MFSYKYDVMDSGRTRKLCISGPDGCMGYAQVVDAWIRDAAFSRFFSGMLASMPYAAFFWEVRPVSMADVECPFECVVVDSSQLAGMQADTTAFADHFGRHAGQSNPQTQSYPHAHPTTADCPPLHTRTGARHRPCLPGELPRRMPHTAWMPAHR